MAKSGSDKDGDKDGASGDGASGTSKVNDLMESLSGFLPSVLVLTGLLFMVIVVSSDSVSTFVASREDDILARAEAALQLFPQRAIVRMNLSTAAVGMAAFLLPMFKRDRAFI